MGLHEGQHGNHLGGKSNEFIGQFRIISRFMVNLDLKINVFFLSKGSFYHPIIPVECTR